MPKKKRPKWIPKLSDEYEQLDTNSWFDIIRYQKDPKFKSNVFCQANNEMIRAERVRIYPSTNQSEN